MNKQNVRSGLIVCPRLRVVVVVALSFLFSYCLIGTGWVANRLNRFNSLRPRIDLPDSAVDSAVGWAVVVTVSEGYDDMFQNWWHWYLKLGLDMPVMMFAEDKQTYAKYRTLTSTGTANFTVERPQGNDVLGSQDYGSKGFISLVGRRPRHILDALARSAKVIYTDIDTVWLADPRPYFTGNYDAWVQVDSPTPFESSAAVNNTRHWWCSCFMAFVNTSRTINLLETWDAVVPHGKGIKQSGYGNQKTFNVVVKKTDVHLRALPCKEFPSGPLYFDDNRREGVVIVHNNYVVGKAKKLKRFARAGLLRPLSLKWFFYWLRNMD